LLGFVSYYKTGIMLYSMISDWAKQKIRTETLNCLLTRHGLAMSIIEYKFPENLILAT
jgi:hypothetical protein